MLHVRVVSPAALTGRLADQLAAAPGVQHLVVHPSAATRPDGDAVQFDLHEGVANPVFRDLRGLGLDRAGAICVDRVDATLADHALTADHGALVRERAPVWEMVEATIRAGAAYSPSFYILLVAAGLIGAVGILTNSQILRGIAAAAAAQHRPAHRGRRGRPVYTAHDLAAAGATITGPVIGLEAPCCMPVWI
jgi:hypothetical protein